MNINASRFDWSSSSAHCSKYIVVTNDLITWRELPPKKNGTILLSQKRINTELSFLVFIDFSKDFLVRSPRIIA